MSDARQDLYRQLPSVDELLLSEDLQPLLQTHAREVVTEAARAMLAQVRGRLGRGELDGAGLHGVLSGLGSLVAGQIEAMLQPRLRRVLNATGVLLQTNLGRAPLSEAALRHLVETARGYCNLEFDLEAGQRSRRDALVEDLLLDLLRQWRAIGLADEGWGAAVVNNCAAATFLALNTVAEGGEVIVSRGELVEIGGGFRVPDILAKSGATLREVGTTNKTRLADYAAAITPATRLLLRVHRSNFRMEGFTEQPSVEELSRLGRERGIPVFHDQGTGCLVDLGTFGIPGESTLTRSLRSGVTLVAASGDKLLGGPQCGLLLGERLLIERMRANPLFRALRVDKLAYAALEATLLAYRGGHASELPLIRMLECSEETIRQRCEAFAAALPAGDWEVEVVPVRSVLGGGTAPGASLPSFAVALRVLHRAEHEIAAALRQQPLPVVARVSEGRVLLDLRTVPPEEDGDLRRVVHAVLMQGSEAPRA